LRQAPDTTQLERLSPEDARILGLESGNVRGHTVKVLLVEGRHDVDAVRRHVAARLGAEPRLRQRLAPTPLRLAPPAWVDDPAFDLSWHVRARPSDGDLRQLVAGVMVEALDRGRPLWRMDVASPVEGDRTAIVWRVHHCMADGGTVMRMATRLFLDSEPSPQPPPAAGWRPAATPPPRALFSAGARERMHRLAEARRTALSPDPWLERWRGLARLPRTVWRELRPSGASSPLDAVAGPRRKVEFVSAELAELKRIEHAAPERVTVNDIVLSVVAGGLRRWLVHRGASLDGLRVKVPVSLHHGAEDGLANRDRFMFVGLPLELGDPHERLLAVGRETRVRKADRDAQILDTLLGDLARVSAPLERRAERWLMSPRVFTLTVSNVRGPGAPVWVMGARLHALHSLAEIADRHALRVAVVSAAGRVSFGLCADADAVDRLELVSEGLAAEIETLLERAR
jgi:diacylglycerol O-acyltransferase / wax synthase